MAPRFHTIPELDSLLYHHDRFMSWVIDSPVGSFNEHPNPSSNALLGTAMRFSCICHCESRMTPKGSSMSSLLEACRPSLLEFPFPNTALQIPTLTIDDLRLRE